MCSGSTFFSGADIAEFAGPPQEEAYRALFRRLEALPVPVIAAMHGTVLGGGLEISLACHYRIALPGTRFGLPEITLGMIPGAGGTQRMPRLIGVEKTLELVLNAKPVDAATAVELGFLDAVVEGGLRAAAIDYATRLVAAGRGPRRTSERAVDPDERDRRGHRAVQEAGGAAVPEPAGSAYGNRGGTAPQRACHSKRVSNTRRGSQTRPRRPTRRRRWSMCSSRSARRARCPTCRRARRRGRCARGAVVGSGTMGGGIAMCFANAGLPVKVLDASREALDRGLAVVERDIRLDGEARAHRRRRRRTGAWR